MGEVAAEGVSNEILLFCSNTKKIWDWELLGLGSDPKEEPDPEEKLGSDPEVEPNPDEELKEGSNLPPYHHPGEEPGHPAEIPAGLQHHP